MNENFLKLLKFIKEQLYFFKDNEALKIHRKKLIELNIPIEDFELGLKKLGDDKIIGPIICLYYGKDGRLAPLDILSQKNILPENRYLSFWVDRLKFNKILEEIQIPKIKIETSNLTNKVREIICVKSEKNNSGIIINGNYNRYLKVDLIKKCWESLFKIADQGYCEMNKEILDYFNSNENNKIYSREGYKLTKILKSTGGNIMSEDGIKIKSISQKAYRTRINKIT